eukprot:m.25996 g.25996  ORF g.25996 m.25996 type:complete len:1136 (+) comp13232_c0_seq1:236-3643(+)
MVFRRYWNGDFDARARILPSLDITELLNDAVSVLKASSGDFGYPRKILSVLCEAPSAILAVEEGIDKIVQGLFSVNLRYSISSCMGHQEQAFHSHILHTAVTLVIELDYIDKKTDQFQLLLDRLLKGISEANQCDVIYRRAACQALHELELAYPGLLARKIGHITTLCEEEMTITAEAYSMLLSCCLRHAVVLLQRQDTDPISSTLGGISEDATPKPTHIKDVCNTENELLYPYYPSAITRKSPVLYAIRNEGGNTDTEQSDESALDDAEVKPIKRVVSLVAHNAGSMNAPALLNAVANLVETCQVLGVRPQVFTSMYASYVTSSNLMHLHALVVVESYFPNVTFVSSLEPGYLWTRLLANLNHGALTDEYFALFLAWLPRWVRTATVATDLVALEKCAPLLPRIFDPPHIMFRKLVLVAKLFGSVQQRPTVPYLERSDSAGSDGGDDENGLVSAKWSVPRALIRLLTCFSDYSWLAPSAPSVQGLLRSLYHLYVLETPHATATRGHVFAFVHKIGVRQPRFLPSVIGLGRAISAWEQGRPDSDYGGASFYLSLLRRLQDAMISASDDAILQDFSHYLALLTALAQETAINPATYLFRLHELLRSSWVCPKGDWEMGTAVLQVCRRLMLHQPTAVILKSLGDTLHLVWSSYNDIDVRDLARFYYMLLTNISGEELRHTLVNKSGTLASINDIMTDNLKLAAACQAADPVATVAPGSAFSGLLRVQRYSPPAPSTQLDEVADAPGGILRSADTISSTPPATVDDPIIVAYQKLLDTTEELHQVSLQLLLGYTPKENRHVSSSHSDSHGDGATADRDSLYAVQLKFVGTEHLRAVAPAHVSVLTRQTHTLGPLKDESLTGSAAQVSRASSVDATVAVGAGGKLVSVRLRPLDPVPTDVRVQVEYTTVDGQTYTEELPQLHVGTGDFVLPLPVEQLQQQLASTVSPGEIFFALWRHIDRHGRVYPIPTAHGAKDSEEGGKKLRAATDDANGATDSLENASRNGVAGGTLATAPASTMMRTTLRFYNVDMLRVLECLAPFLLASARNVPSKADEDGEEAWPAKDEAVAPTPSDVGRQLEDNEYQFLAGLLLVPSIHVLLQGRVWCEDEFVCVMDVITDNGSALPFLHQYLCDLLRSSTF